MKLSFSLRTINHKSQRYDTLGDYYYKNGAWQITVSKKGSKDEQFAVMIHELIELYLTQKRGIAEKEIMAFDKKHPRHSDPGFHPLAPYKKEHTFANMIELMILEELEEG